MLGDGVLFVERTNDSKCTALSNPVSGEGVAKASVKSASILLIKLCAWDPKPSELTMVRVMPYLTAFGAAHCVPHEHSEVRRRPEPKSRAILWDELW